MKLANWRVNHILKGLRVVIPRSFIARAAFFAVNYCREFQPRTCAPLFLTVKVASHVSYTHNALGGLTTLWLTEADPKAKGMRQGQPSPE
jgi:hypothetical protein